MALIKIMRNWGVAPYPWTTSESICCSSNLVLLRSRCLWHSVHLWFACLV